MTSSYPTPPPPEPDHSADCARAPDHYAVILDSITQGFCVIEVLFDDSGRAADYRFLETNAAFAQQSGLGNAVGRRMREIAPTHEREWFEIYGNVAKTGTPIRFARQAAALEERWFDVYAFRLGPPECRQVGVLFTDITEQVRLERSAQMLTEMSGALITLTRESDLPGIVRAKAGPFFQLSQCAFAELDLERRVVKVNRSWDPPAGPPVAGVHTTTNS